MSAEWEQYRDRYRVRPETFDAYVDVWINNPDARSRFSSWSMFSRCASAEPDRVRNAPHLVARAEDMMRAAGYTMGTPSGRGARRWVRGRADGQVETSAGAR